MRGTKALLVWGAVLLVTTFAFPERAGADVGDTFSTALVTGLGPTAGSYTMPTQNIGDNTYGAADVDMYSVEAQAGWVLIALTSFPSGGIQMDNWLRIFDSAGNVLGIGDDGSGVYATRGVKFPASGTYYIGISSNGNTHYDPTVAGSGIEGCCTGDYRLDLELGQCLTPPESDVGDMICAALETGLGPGLGSYSTTEQIGDSPLGGNDVDLYRFQAAAGTTVRITTPAPPDVYIASTLLTLFDSAGNQLDSNAIEVQKNLPSGGIYYVGVSALGNWGYDPNIPGDGIEGCCVGNYGLKLELLDEGTPVQHSTWGSVKARYR